MWTNEDIELYADENNLYEELGIDYDPTEKGGVPFTPEDPIKEYRRSEVNALKNK